MFKETKFSEIKNNFNKLNIDGTSADRYRCFIDGDTTYLTNKEVVGRHINCGGVVIGEWVDLYDVTGYICLKCNEYLSKHCFVDLDEDIIKDYEEHLKFLSDYIVAHKETLKDYCNDKHDIVGELDSDGFTNDASRHTYNVLKNNGFVDKAYIELANLDYMLDNEIRRIESEYGDSIIQINGYSYAKATDSDAYYGDIEYYNTKTLKQVKRVEFEAGDYFDFIHDMVNYLKEKHPNKNIK